MRQNQKIRFSLVLAGYVLALCISPIVCQNIFPQPELQTDNFFNVE